jgi:hypothetical protein
MWARPLGAALLGVTLHLPFALRYDLHFQPDFAISLLISRSILEGERPIFFWGQEYLGTYGNYLTALAFRFAGVSVPVAGLVTLAIWALGVGVTTALAQRLWGGRVAAWVGAAAAVASPYANHYITQPYSSYESAALLAVVVLAAVSWSGERGGPRRAAVPAWVAFGSVLGLGWWTTRLFLPILGAVLLAAGACAGVSRRSLRAALRPGLLLVAGVLIGASPEIAHRLDAHRNARPANTRRVPLLELASLPMMIANGREAARTLPAYFNGDPQARLPEGIAFARALERGRRPDPRAAHSQEPAALAHDRLVEAAVLLVLVAALATCVPAWRGRNAPLLAVCLSPAIHLAFIVMSARTGGGYYEARRYWFASLLIFPLLLGNLVAVCGTSRRVAVRGAARVIVGGLIVSSLVAQGRMLTLPDELAAYRTLTADLTAEGARTVVMPSWTGWVVAALAGGEIDVVTLSADRHPPLLERAATRDRAVMVLPPGREFPAAFALRGARFERADDMPRPSAVWRWLPYRLVARRRPAAGEPPFVWLR